MIQQGAALDDRNDSYEMQSRLERQSIRPAQPREGIPSRYHAVVSECQCSASLTHSHLSQPGAHRLAPLLGSPGSPAALRIWWQSSQYLYGMVAPL